MTGSYSTNDNNLTYIVSRRNSSIIQIPLRISQKFSNTPETSSRSFTKGSPRSIHQGRFSYRMTSSTLLNLWGGEGNPYQKTGQLQDAATPRPTALSISTTGRGPRRPGLTPLGSHKYASDVVRLESKCNYHGDFLTATNDSLFGVYQDWVHQNPGTHLYGSIEEGGRWKNICKNIFFFTTQRYDIPPGRIGDRFVANLLLELDGI